MQKGSDHRSVTIAGGEQSQEERLQEASDCMRRVRRWQVIVGGAITGGAIAGGAITGDAIT